MFDDRTQAASSKTDDCCKSAAVKTEDSGRMNLLSVAKAGNEVKGCACGCGGSGGCCGDKAADKKKDADKNPNPGIHPGVLEILKGPYAPTVNAKDNKACDGCCACCGAKGGCACEKKAEKKEAGKGEKDLVEKGIDFVNGAGFPKIASVLKTIYEEGKALVIPPLDCCDPKKGAAKPGEGCPCGCGGAGACCKPKDGKKDEKEKDKEKPLTFPPLDSDKSKDGPKKPNSKDNCEGCKCGCGGAGGCVCDSKKPAEKAKEQKDKEQKDNKDVPNPVLEKQTAELIKGCAERISTIKPNEPPLAPSDWDYLKNAVDKIKEAGGQKALDKFLKDVSDKSTSGFELRVQSDGRIQTAPKDSPHVELRIEIGTRK